MLKEHKKEHLEQTFSGPEGICHFSIPYSNQVGFWKTKGFPHFQMSSFFSDNGLAFPQEVAIITSKRLFTVLQQLGIPNWNIHLGFEEIRHSNSSRLNTYIS